MQLFCDPDADGCDVPHPSLYGPLLLHNGRMHKLTPYGKALFFWDLVDDRDLTST